MYKKLCLAALLVCGSLSAAQAESLSLELELPALNTVQYEPPFVAVWLEQKGQRRASKTLSVWYDKKKWLKDIRQWWRKAGRYSDDATLDGVSGATRVPGRYPMQWSLDELGLAAGDYVLYLEAVREHGNRSLLKQAISLGTGQAQSYTLEAAAEIGPVTIHIQP